MIQPGTPADSIRAALHQVFANSEFAWKDESSPTLVVRRWWAALIDWLTRLEGDHPALFKLLIYGLVTSLAVIALHAIWVLVRTTRARPGSGPRGPAAGTAEVRDAAWFGREAERLFREGRCAAAIQAEFVRLSLDLDARDLVRFHPSKTPRDYWIEARLPEPARAELRALIRDVYRYAFAGDPCGAPEFLGWRSRAASGWYASQP